MVETLRSSQKALVLILALCCSSFALESCSTVNVEARQASKADDIQKTTVWALFWGASDPVESVDCNGNGLQIVSTSTSWLYSLCTVITLGAVVPMDVEYRCTSEPLQGGDEINDIGTEEHQ